MASIRSSIPSSIESGSKSTQISESLSTMTFSTILITIFIMDLSTRLLLSLFSLIFTFSSRNLGQLLKYCCLLCPFEIEKLPMFFAYLIFNRSFSMAIKYHSIFCSHSFYLPISYLSSSSKIPSILPLHFDIPAKF